MRKNLKTFFFSFALGLSGLALGATISRVTNFVDNQVLTAAQLNSEFNNLVDGANNLNDANLITNANINPVKIAATIKGDGIARNGSTGQLSADPDLVGLELASSKIALKDKGVTNAKLRDSAALSVIGNPANSSGSPQDIVASTAGHVLVNSGTSIGFGQISTSTIPDSAITTAKIANSAVTLAKLATPNYAISNGSGTFSTSSSSLTDVTNLSVTLTTTGRPVMLKLIHDGSSNYSQFLIQYIGGASPMGYIDILRDGTRISRQKTLFTQFDNRPLPPSSISHVDEVGAGTYTYKVQVAVDGASSGNFFVHYMKLYAQEIGI